ncbi:MAG TPA: hypothetical protein VH372_03785 [Actinospica sp.]|jgi:Fe-S cluster assembly iron-binding protein IscA|nr:hypothetical protein [Actinospica sp.]
MLMLTDAAEEVIDELATEPDLPETAGLRIALNAADEAEPEWSAALTACPGPEDEVLEVRHGHLYLDPAAADRLTDRILDAGTVDDEVVFHVRRQPSDEDQSESHEDQGE